MTLRSITKRVLLPENNQGQGFTAAMLAPDNGNGFDLDPFINLTDFQMPRAYFPPHPHAGFSVMTYMFEDSAGAFINRDSFGDHTRLEPGSLLWTQAGRGIQHEEIPEVEGTPCHGLQMWVNLANADKLAPPAVYYVAAADVPEHRTPAGSRVRVLVGSAQGLRAPFQPLSTITLLDVQLLPNDSYRHRVAEGHRAFAMVIGGAGTAGPEAVPLLRHAAVAFDAAGDEALVQAGPEGLQLLLGIGLPLREPVVFGGPFVAASPAELHQTKLRYGRGEMGTLEPSPVFLRRPGS